MSLHTAEISWTLDGDFLANRYSRVHTIRFDGGVEVAGSASPSVVPLPLSSEAAADPEEIFIASVSACHMLWFLDLARQAGLTVTSYKDAAVGEMTRAGRGKHWISKITLNPDIIFEGDQPDAKSIDIIHHEAHERCFIANSVKTEIVVGSR